MNVRIKIGRILAYAAGMIGLLLILVYVITAFKIAFEAAPGGLGSLIAGLVALAVMSISGLIGFFLILISHIVLRNLFSKAISTLSGVLALLASISLLWKIPLIGAIGALLSLVLIIVTIRLK